MLLFIALQWMLRDVLPCTWQQQQATHMWTAVLLALLSSNT
jgi:hypothetical protein